MSPVLEDYANMRNKDGRVETEALIMVEHDALFIQWIQ